MTSVRFERLEDCDKYVAAQGIDGLRRLLMQDSLHPSCRRVAECWLWEAGEKDRERVVYATEDAARAAKESALTAREAGAYARASARWAMWAVVVGVVAAAVAVLK